MKRTGIQRRDWIKRGTKPLAQRKPRKRKPRKPSETLRIYGPPERRAWVKSLACTYCFAVHPLIGLATAGSSHNAHTVTGGTGRKADYTTIVPLCASHHKRYDEHQAPFDSELVRDAMKASAALVEQEWQQRRAS
jgi:hypothetical protein